MRAAALLCLLGPALLAACGTNLTPEPEPAVTLPACVPDRDGTITADELPVALGATAAYYQGRDVPVMLAGDGAWDLSEERAADEVIALGPVALGARWYAAMFPGAAFVVDAGEGLDGVFHQDAQGLFLHGTASREPDPPGGTTLVRYRDPIPALRFPVADGGAYSATGEIADGMVAGLPFVGSDRLAVEIAGAGRLAVPYVTFSPVLRVRTQLVRTPSTGSPVIARRTTLFLFECFGEVARADSRVDEPNPDFTIAASLRRFALGVEP